MARIFRGATRVLAWLDGGADEERGMQQLAKVSRYWRFDIEQNLKGLSGPDFPIWERKSVGDFLHLAWFTRLWIVQEVVFSTDAVIFCGTSELSWLRLTVALDTLIKVSPETVDFIGFEIIAALRSIATLWRHHCSIVKHHSDEVGVGLEGDILSLMHRFHSYGCTYERDRIFALYNISDSMQPISARQKLQERSNAQQHVFIDVDYRHPVEEIYRRFAIACLESGRATSVLNSVLRRPLQQDSTEWPRWVPDWRLSPVDTNLSLERVECCEFEGNRICTFAVRNIPSAIPDGQLPIVISRLPADSLGSFTTALHDLAKVTSTRNMAWLLAMLIPAEHEMHCELENFVRQLQSGVNVLATQNPRLAYSQGYGKYEARTDLWDEPFFDNFHRGSLQKKPSVRHTDIMHRLQTAMQHKCFFMAALPTDVYLEHVFIGFADERLQAGDRLAPYKIRRVTAEFCFGATAALLLRPQDLTKMIMGCNTCAMKDTDCEGLYPACFRCTQNRLVCRYEDDYKPPLHKLMGTSCIAPCEERPRNDPDSLGVTVVQLC